nr:hypothetical protein [Bacillus sp. FJAT-27245]
MGEWIIDNQQVETIVDKINEIPDVYKKNERFLDLAIQEDEQLQVLNPESKKGCLDLGDILLY